MLVCTAVAACTQDFNIGARETATLTLFGCAACGEGFACALERQGCVCVPDCRGKDCGNDGCDSSCGSCGAGDVCNVASGVCGAQCVPAQCEDIGATCGAPSDGCGGTLSCGICADDGTCSQNNTCQCVQDCANKDCGDNGCGDDCGDCPTGTLCSEANECVCAPNCTDRLCGDDGCGGSCGDCPADQICNLAIGMCGAVCNPVTCDDLDVACGGAEDGCGATLDCGTCPSGQECSATGRCELDCQAMIPGLLQCSGFEDGLDSIDDRHVGGGALDTTTLTAHSGSSSLRARSDGGGGVQEARFAFEPVSSGTVYVRAYFQIPEGSVSDFIKVVSFMGVGVNDLIVDINVESSGRMFAYFHASTEREDSADGVFPFGQWVCLQASVTVSGDMGQSVVAIDDQQVLISEANQDTLLGEGLAQSGVGIGYSGVDEDTTTVYVDDFTVATEPVDCW